MRRRTLLIVAAVLCLDLTAASGQQKEIRDATIADPEVHQVVLENDHVRVFEAMAEPGHKSPMHSHPPMVVMSCDSARMKLTPAGGETQILDLQPGTVLWIDGTQHSWELFAGSLHAFAVEPKSAQAGAAAGAQQAVGAQEHEVPDATVVDPEVHHVVLENDHVRVFEVMAAPGHKSPMHSHPPLVLMSCDSARIKMTPAGGETQIFDAKPGTVLWIDGLQHSWELFAGNLDGFAVEPKAAQAGKAAPGE
jgi:quercetin dioxygenase-like cupin family protein